VKTPQRQPLLTAGAKLELDGSPRDHPLSSSRATKKPNDADAYVSRFDGSGKRPQP
jgi:hypothetical protein